MKADTCADLIVTGGGPAGMMAAIAAASCGTQVTLIEKNPSCGKKLLLAGGGRCNFTNACDKDDFSAHYFRGGKFLRDAFKLFSNRDLIEFFKNRGVASYSEPDGRVFPSSNDGADILQALLDEMKRQKITVLLREPLKTIILSNKTVTTVKTVKRILQPRKGLILSTGGISYPQTGSDGSGLALAKKTGHTVTPLAPGLSGIVLDAPYLKKLPGISLRDVTLTFSAGKKKIRTPQGDILFTDTGLSGPLVISFTSGISGWFREQQAVQVSVDFLPEVPKENLLKTLTEQWQKHGRRAIKNAIGFLPQRLIQILLAAHHIDPDKNTAYISKAERNAIVGMLKEMTWKVISSEPIEKAMVTSGGVFLKEIDPRSMASRLVKRLYFAGEMLDIDGDTGGFNLQAAFSTGYCAGIHAAKQTTCLL